MRLVLPCCSCCRGKEHHLVLGLMESRERSTMEEAVAVVKTADGDISSALRVVAENARSPHGRQVLASFDAVPVLLSRLRVCSSSFCDDSSSSLVLLLRALRNLCAGEGLNQDAFVRCSGIELVASVVCKAVELHRSLVNSDGFGDSEAGSCWLNVFKALLQLLGNVAARGEVAQASIWDIFFPELFLDLACVSAEEVHEPLSMVLYNCFRTSGERRLQLTQGKGARVLAILLRDSESNASEAMNDWLSLVVEGLCLNDDHFPVVFKSLGPSTGNQQAFSSEQAILLSMICAALDDKNGSSSSEKLPMPVDSLLFLVDIIEHAAACVGSTISEKGISWPTGLPSSDVLGFSLLLGRLLCAYEDAAPAQVSGQDKLKKVSDLLASKGLLEHSLEMLRALGPPELVRKAMQLDGNGTTEKQTGNKKCEQPLSEMGVSDSLEQQPQPSAVGERFLVKQFPRQNPYKGYRRDIVAVIANMAFHNFGIQEQVRENGGLLLILQQCVVDEDNPYLREWGLWAVRNLTEGNAQNIQELANLELRKPVNTEEILKAGLKVEVDARTRRPKLVNLASAEGDKQQSSD